MPEPRLGLTAGTRLGPYEIVAPLGAGGMGEVYRAHDERLRRDVAIKVVTAARADDPDHVRRLEQEGQTLGSLNHPNILAVYDIGTRDGALYVVSELLEGETLREHLAAGPIPLPAALDIAVQIGVGLAAAHERGIVHRDLKPENIFLTRDGRVKILDFGLAKVTSNSGDGETVTFATAAGVVLGTAGYISPEQVRGLAADHRSDVFAFGAVLYELFSGQRAFQRGSMIETMSATLTADPAPMATSDVSLSPALEAVVRRCLAKEPGARYQSAKDVAFTLEQIGRRSGSPVDVPPRIRQRTAWIGAALLMAAAIG
jgi:serine/threonine protein kinase